MLSAQLSEIIENSFNNSLWETVARIMLIYFLFVSDALKKGLVTRITEKQMNIFFYSKKAAGCGSSCFYFSCPHRCLGVLRKMPILQDMVTLPGDLHSMLPYNTHLRSGDILILYAASWSELEELIAYHERFESLRIILIVAGEDFVTNGRWHCLRPRFITTISKTMHELEMVLGKMVAAHGAVTCRV